jgi:hypothetical protein
MSGRLTVRSAYQRGWQVADGSTIIHTFDGQEGAFQFLVDRGARVRLHWGRTIIGGEAAPFDFCSSFQGERVGRIRKELHPPAVGISTWSCFVGGAKGSQPHREMRLCSRSSALIPGVWLGPTGQMNSTPRAASMLAMKKAQRENNR